MITDNPMVYDLSQYNNNGIHVMDEVIADKSNILSTRKTMTEHMIGNSSIILDTALSRSIEIYKKIAVTETLPSEYRMKPHHYSYYKYNTYQMWYLLMKLNDVAEPMDFKMDTVKFLDRDGIILYINNIKNLKEDSYGIDLYDDFKKL